MRGDFKVDVPLGLSLMADAIMEVVMKHSDEGDFDFDNTKSVVIYTLVEVGALFANPEINAASVAEDLIELHKTYRAISGRWN